MLRVGADSNNKAVFRAVCADGDDGNGNEVNTEFLGDRVHRVNEEISKKIQSVNKLHFSDSTKSKLPMTKRLDVLKYNFLLNGPQFFGFGLNPIKKMLETMEGIER